MQQKFRNWAVNKEILMDLQVNKYLQIQHILLHNLFRQGVYTFCSEGKIPDGKQILHDLPLT